MLINVEYLMDFGMLLTLCVCLSLPASACLRVSQPYRLREVPGGGPVRGGKGGGEPMAISGSWVK